MIPETVRPTALAHYTGLIKAGTPFAFSRWGDGEWNAIFHRPGANCDGHQYFPRMGEQLGEVLRRRPGYYLGMQQLALRLHAERIDRFLRHNDLTDLVWHESDALHHAAERDRSAFDDFILALRERHVIVVGGGHLKTPLRDLLDYKTFVEVPRQNCFSALRYIQRDLLQALPKEPTVVLLSCSMPAEIILDNTWRHCGGERCRHSFIDAGSVWDPFAGVYSRRYMRRMAQQGAARPVI